MHLQIYIEKNVLLLKIKNKNKCVNAICKILVIINSKIFKFSNFQSPQNKLV